VATPTPRLTPDSPAVSIVTPTLNQARFLQRTLDSVAAQRYPVREHIVIDGGSTDGTLDILSRAGNHGPIRWKSEPDEGMYDAVNKGLALTSGDIIGYLPSDDVYLPWAVEAAVEAFATNPATDLVFGDGITFEEDTGTQILRLYAPFDRVSLANYASLFQPAVFWRRRLYERLGGFDAGMRYVADLDYWLRAAAAGATIAHLDEVLSVERVHEDRLSTASREAMQAEEQAMRAGHAGADFGPEARHRAQKRYNRWQRTLWTRFLVASWFRVLPGPWRRFLREGHVSVDGLRVLAGLHRHHKLRTAMTSGLAADLVRVGQFANAVTRD
jgi:glycosyltransferase involved in cell wall biosynthesis